MKRSPKSLLFVLILIFRIPCLQAEISGVLEYSVSDGEITITGLVDEVQELVIPDTIEGLPVTIIDSGAFTAREDLTRVTIGSNVHTLGQNAFANCPYLTSVSIPNGMVSIGDQAFSSCSSLVTVIIPESVASIGEAAFSACYELGGIYVDPSNVFYSSLDGALYDEDFNVLHQVPGGFVGDFFIPDSVSTIENQALRGCREVTAVTIPDGLTSIGDWAFYGCEKLTIMTIPSSIHTMGKGVFSYCTSLTTIQVDIENPELASLNGVLFNKSMSSLLQYPGGLEGDYVIPDSVNRVSSYAFQGCTNLTGITIPDSATILDDGAFLGCTGLTEAIIPDSVTTIGLSTFASCDSLEKVILSSSLRTIQTGTFMNCSSLSSIIIPDSIINLSTAAFYRCSSLSEVYFLGNQPDENFLVFDLTSPDLAVYFFRGNTSWGSTFTGKATTPFDFELQLSAGEINVTGFQSSSSQVMIPAQFGQILVTSIGTRAFAKNSSITEVSIPESVLSIGDSPFSDCPNLTSITVSDGNPAYTSVNGILFNEPMDTLVQFPAGQGGDYEIPDTVTQIAIEAFYGCSELTSIAIPGAVASIGEAAFKRCSGLTSIQIPASATTIAKETFSYCENLADISIPESVDSIGSGAFEHCGFSAIELPQGLTVVSHRLFGNCANLKEITLPDGITSIGDGAFESCTALTYLGIPDSVTTVGVAAFRNCTRLTSMVLGQEVTSIGFESFAGCQSLTSIVMEAETAQIGTGAFRHCINLTEVDFPDRLQFLGDFAFEGCTSLTEIYIPDVSHTGNSTFLGCTALSDITLYQTNTLGNEVFAGCTSLSSLVIPSTVDRIGPEAFRNCSSLDSLYFLGQPATFDFNWPPFEGVTPELVIYYLPESEGWGESFAGYPTDKFMIWGSYIAHGEVDAFIADTGAWLGLVEVSLHPFIWQLDRQGWLYVPESVALAGRGWLYLFDVPPESSELLLSMVSGTNWGYSFALNKWFHFTRDDPQSTTDWVYTP